MTERSGTLIVAVPPNTDMNSVSDRRKIGKGVIARRQAGAAGSAISLLLLVGHECALFFFLCRQQFEQFRFLVYECSLSHLYFFKLCLQIGNLIVLHRKNLCSVMPGHCIVIALFNYTTEISYP